MDDLFNAIKEHPVAIGLAVIAVALIAYFASQSQPQSMTAGDLQFTGGGVAPIPVDPGVVEMETARINAGVSNFGTLASYLLGSQQTVASENVELAGIGSNERVAIRGYESSEERARIEAGTAINSAKINQETQYRIIDANYQQSLLNQQQELERNATQRDIARVQAKAEFWDSLIGGVSSVVSHLNPLSWF